MPKVKELVTDNRGFELSFGIPSTRAEAEERLADLKFVPLIQNSLLVWHLRAAGVKQWKRALNVELDQGRGGPCDAVV